MDTTWIKNHKMVVGLFGAAVVGYVLYSFLHRGSSAASGSAAPVVGGGSPQYLVPIVQSPGIDTAGMSPQSVAQTGSTPNPPNTSTTPATNTPSPATPNQLPTTVNVPGVGLSYVLGPTGNPNDYKLYGGLGNVWYGVAQPNGVGQGQSAYNTTLGWGYEYAPVATTPLQDIYAGPSKIPAPGPV